MTVKSKFYQLGTVSADSSTVQYLELTNIDTDYAVLRFVFSGIIDHTGGGNTNVTSNGWQSGVSIQFQEAWSGGANSGAAKYRNLQCFQNGSSYWESKVGVTNSTSPVTDYGEQGRQYYGTTSPDGYERFTLEGICVQPGNNQSKSILWKGSGLTPGGNATASAYSSSGWFGVTKLDAQNSNSAPTAMSPMSSIRIGAGWDPNGVAKYFKVFSNLTVFGEGWTSDVQTGSTD